MLKTAHTLTHTKVKLWKALWSSNKPLLFSVMVFHQTFILSVPVSLAVFLSHLSVCLSVWADAGLHSPSLHGMLFPVSLHAVCQYLHHQKKRSCCAKTKRWIWRDRRFTVSLCYLFCFYCSFRRELLQGCRWGVMECAQEMGIKTSCRSTVDSWKVLRRPETDWKDRE